jgi:hypothetical protein
VRTKTDYQNKAWGAQAAREPVPPGGAPAPVPAAAPVRPGGVPPSPGRPAAPVPPEPDPEVDVEDEPDDDAGELGDEGYRPTPEEAVQL